jgi:hypothetical protein
MGKLSLKYQPGNGNSHRKNPSFLQTTLIEIQVVYWKLFSKEELHIIQAEG